MSTIPTEPTKSQLALAQFADECEETGVKPAHYWRLTPQILEARAAIASYQKAKGQ